MARKPSSTDVDPIEGLSFGFYRVIDRDNESSDPLGLRASERAVADILFPGFTSARRLGKSLALCVLGVALTADDADDEVRETFRRFEHLCIWSLALGSTSRPNNVAIGGLRWARERAPSDGRSSIEDLGAKIGANGNAAIWGNWRLAEHLRLVLQETERVKLTPLGERFISNFIRMPQFEEVERQINSKTGSVKVAKLKGLASWLDEPLHYTRRVMLREAMSQVKHLGVDRYYDTIEASVRLDEQGLDARKLPAPIKVPWAAALQISQIICQVEDPFRRCFGVAESFRDPVAAGPKLVDDVEKLEKYLSKVGSNTTACQSLQSVGRLLRDRGASLTGNDLYGLHTELQLRKGRAPWDREIPRNGRTVDTVGEGAEDEEPDIGLEDDEDSESGIADQGGSSLLSPILWARLQRTLEFSQDIARKGGP